MGESVENLEQENELKDNKIDFLAVKLGTSDEQIIQETEQINPIYTLKKNR